MRLVIVAAGLATASICLSSCGPSAREQAETNAAIANFTPPFVLSRLDFGGVIERRFRRLDRSGDDKLQPTEVPQRWRARTMQLDTDADGAVSAEEWSTGQLARFDRQDLNRDGTVTSDEREKARAEQEGDLPTPADEPAGNSAAARR